MTSTGTLKRLKRELQYTCSLVAPQIWAYDTLVNLSFKSFFRTLVLAFKSKQGICSFFSLLYLLIQHKFSVFGFKTSKS